MADAPPFGPLDLKRARILVTNDDGIRAAGLAELERLARQITDDVVVCAPEQEQSGAGHSLTIHRPLRLRDIDARHFAVDGTPTDCVLLAINHILSNDRPTLVLSGLNYGTNLAEDVTYSGTVAAAMEATLLGVPAVALSLGLDASGQPGWGAAAAYLPEVLKGLSRLSWPEDVLMNVNFPARPAGAVQGIRTVPQGRTKQGDSLDERVDPRGRRYFWIGESKSRPQQDRECDITALADGAVTVTPVHLDMTHTGMLAKLHDVFDGAA